MGLVPLVDGDQAEPQDHHHDQQQHPHPQQPQVTQGQPQQEPPQLQGNLPQAPALPFDSEWLPTLRCVDTNSGETFSRRGRTLWCSSIDHSVAVLRTNQEGQLQLFMTSALHAKSGAAQPELPATSCHLRNQQCLHPYQGHMHPISWPYPPSGASSVIADMVPSPSRTRATRGLVYNDNHPQASSTAGSSSEFGGQAFLPHPRSYCSAVNPHFRVGRYAEGDHQVLRYKLSGNIEAATVDDTSGKIAFVVERYRRLNIVVLDYGWDFWKIEANDEYA